jgi:hypothetical protein
MPAEETSSHITGASDAVTGRPDLGELGSGRLLASAALIGAGVLIEPELLGGALLGAGVVYGLPLVGQLLRPVMSTAVQLGFLQSLRSAICWSALATRSRVSSLPPARITNGREARPSFPGAKELNAGGKA